MVLRGRPRGRVGHRRTLLPKKADPHRDRLSLRCAPTPKPRSNAKIKCQSQRRARTSGWAARANFRRHSFGRPAESFPEPPRPPLSAEARSPVPGGPHPAPARTPSPTSPHLSAGPHPPDTVSTSCHLSPRPGRRPMITKDWCSYTIRILRQEISLRDHGQIMAIWRPPSAMLPRAACESCFTATLFILGSSWASREQKILEEFFLAEDLRAHSVQIFHDHFPAHWPAG